PLEPLGAPRLRDRRRARDEPGRPRLLRPGGAVGGREPRRGRPELTPDRLSPAAGGGAPATRRHWAEEHAERALAANGYAVLRRSYRPRGGEIGHGSRAPEGTGVFVAARQGRAAGFGGGAESLSAAKLGRLRDAAAHFLARELGRPEASARFDVVLVAGAGPGARLTHLEDAF